MINKDRVIARFMEMVQIDSESGQEREMIDYMTDLFQGWGYEVIEDNAAARAGTGAGNLLVNIPGQIDSHYKLMFTAHVDTVVPGKGIVPVIRDGYIYSQGETILGGDDKAGLASIIEMVEVLRENQLEHGDIQLAITVSEEIGLVGAKNFDQGLLKSNMGIALDSNGDVGRMIMQGPVQKTMVIDIKGKSAHAGIAPEEGISAIEIMADAISQMPLGRIDEDTTANIGIVQGGKATNIVCDQVKINAEARSVIRTKLDEQIEKMEEAVRSAVAKRGGEYSFVVTEEYPEFSFDKEDPEVQLVARSMARIEVKPVYAKSGGGSDANIFNGYGIKTINLGIGMEGIHTTNERIAIDQIHEMSALLVEIVKEAAKS